MTKLNLGTLERVVQQLEKGIARSEQNKSDEELLDAVILRFEYTYELCWKMLKRQLEIEVPTPSDIDKLSFNDLIRLAAEMGMITAVKPWFEYREARNKTSHTYDGTAADEVYALALKMIIDARNLLTELQRR